MIVLDFDFPEIDFFKESLVMQLYKFVYYGQFSFEMFILAVF